MSKIDMLNCPTQIGIPLNETGLAKYIRDLRQKIETKDFDIVGITCWTSEFYQSAILTAKIVKAINKNAIIVVGGYHPSVKPADFQFENSPFDYIVVGEGEYPFVDYVLEGSVREKPVIITNNKPFNLENLLNLNWELLKDLNISKWNLGFIYLSRGCAFNCSFCLEKSKSPFNWNFLSPKKGIYLIRELINHYPEIKLINIHDPIFGLKRTWRKTFLDLLEKEEIVKDKEFFIETRVDIVDKDDIRTFAKLNFQVFFGVENLSRKMLLIMNKTKNPELYLNLLKKINIYAEEFQLKWICQLLIGHPGETENTIEENKKFIRDNFKDKQYWTPYISIMRMHPGSHVSEHLPEYEKKYGTSIQYPEWWKLPPMYQDFDSTDADKINPSNSLTYQQVHEQFNAFRKLFRNLKEKFIDSSLKRTIQNIQQELLSLLKDKDFLMGDKFNRIYDLISDHHFDLILF